MNEVLVFLGKEQVFDIFLQEVVISFMFVIVKVSCELCSNVSLNIFNLSQEEMLWFFVIFNDFVCLVIVYVGVSGVNDQVNYLIVCG